MTQEAPAVVSNFNFQPLSGTPASAIRVVTIEGNPWFVAIDVCRALGINVSKGTFMALTKLDQHEKRVVTTNPFGGSGKPTLISESGLYKLVMRSDKPEAKAFQDWVTKVVLPAIRKDGGYVQGEEKLEALVRDWPGVGITRH